MAQIINPYEIFLDIDGDPLKNGYLYIGLSGLNAEANPISVFWDESLTIPASQPIRTLNGYASRDGTPSNLFIPENNYSIIVKNKNGTLVYSTLNNNQKIADIVNSGNLKFSTFAKLGTLEATIGTLLLKDLDYLYDNELEVETIAYYDGWAALAKKPEGGGKYTLMTTSQYNASIYNGHTKAAIKAGSYEYYWVPVFTDEVHIEKCGSIGDRNIINSANNVIAIQTALVLSVSLGIPMQIGSGGHYLNGEVNIDNFIGQDNITVQIIGTNYASNYQDVNTQSQLIRDPSYNSNILRLNCSSDATGGKRFTVVLYNFNMWGNNAISDAMYLTLPQLYMARVGIQSFNYAVQLEESYRSSIHSCSLAKNISGAIKGAGYNSVLNIYDNQLRDNSTVLSMTPGYSPKSYTSPSNRFDNVNINGNNLESNATIFDFRNGATSHIEAHYNYNEAIGSTLFDCSGSFSHFDIDYKGMGNQLHCKFNVCRDVYIEGESIFIDEYSEPNSVNLVVRNKDTRALNSATNGQSTADMVLIPNNMTNLTLNDDPDFSLHSCILTPFILPREYSLSSVGSTYIWATDTPYGRTKRVLKVSATTNEQLINRSPLGTPRSNGIVYALVSIRVESGSIDIGNSLNNGGQNFGSTILTADTVYQQAPLRIPFTAGNSTVEVRIKALEVGTVYYVNLIAVAFTLHPEFKQSTSFTNLVSVPNGAGLTLTGDRDLFVSATIEGIANKVGVNGNGTTAPAIVHDDVGAKNVLITVTPHYVTQHYRMN